MRKLTDTDRKILEIAEEMIMEKGIADTDMKDIAKVMGCSRSTLYRHFLGKADILIYLASGALDRILDSQRIPKEIHFRTGFDAFAWQLNSMTEHLSKSVRDVTFIMDYDCLYSRNLPETETAEEFVEFVRLSSTSNPLYASYIRGIEDGSILDDPNPELTVLSIIHSTIALAERIIPGEGNYRKGFGYGSEMMKKHAEMVLKSIC